MKLKQIVFSGLGLVCFVLGTIGVFLPFLPTTPFYLLTLFFFVNSSKRLHNWFIGTELYKKHLDSFIKKKGMLLSTKVYIIITITLMMGFAVFMMGRKGVWIPCIIVCSLWLLHILYFTLCVNTIKKEDVAEKIIQEESENKKTLDEITNT